MVFEKKEHKIALGLAVVATVGAGIWAFFHYSDSEVKTEVKKEEIGDQQSMVSSIPISKDESKNTKPEQSPVKKSAPVKEESAPVKEESAPVIKKEESAPVIKKDPTSAETVLFKEPEVPVSRYEMLVKNLKQRAELQKLNQYLDMGLLMGINDALIMACGDDFAKIQIMMRIARRACKQAGDVTGYTQQVFAATQNIEYMLIGHMDNVLKECDVTMQKFELSSQYMSQINPQFAMISMLILDKMKMQMQSTKKCTLQTVLDIFDYQLEVYPSLKDVITVQDPQMLPMIKQSWLSDLVFEKFGMEEEDYIRAPGLDGNMEFRTKAEKLAGIIQADTAMMFGGMDMGGMF